MASPLSLFAGEDQAALPARLLRRRRCRAEDGEDNLVTKEVTLSERKGPKRK